VHTKGVWIYELRTNKHFTLKTRTLRRDELQDFIDCYSRGNRHQRNESERFKYFDYKTLTARDSQPRHLLAQGRQPR
jgi:type I restriction enzyme M protein